MRFALLKFFSWPLECLLRFRHFLFDKGFVASREGSLPTVVIGNLSLGGTGKTPFSAWVCRYLVETSKVALLSRGYGRKGKGFLQVSASSKPKEVGDEPLMQCLNLPDVGVAVCVDRLSGIDELKNRGYEVVVLDDAFQHRRLNGSVKILLTRQDRPFWSDQLFPLGYLRDVAGAAKRADVLVVTNCPSIPSPEFIMQAELQGFERGKSLFFTGLEYLSPYDVRTLEVVNMESMVAFGVCGVANDSGFKSFISSHYDISGYKRFADHHHYSENDFDELPAGSNCIITTEKDAVKLRLLNVLSETRIIALPIRLKFLEGEENLKIVLSRSITHLRK